uniref:glycogenin-1-like isoform X3 n=1 Tax=Styela clava TaxID=7725 RepID=UPI00193ADAA8|nr:glycogenin-1-like isoform X3 [Styela clava]
MADCNKKHNDEAFITLATNDVYTRGALVLAQSLRKYGTTRKLVVMITPHVSPNARTALEDVFDDVRLVDVLDSRDAAHLALLKRPELGITFTKIHCWTLTEYSKGVFMDADMMALQNIDELFEREELSAAPDSGWPDLFNSGLFVFRPSLETFNGLLLLAQNEGSFDGGDQGLLNTYFKDWATKDISRHLPFLYNLHVCASYTYMPAFKKFGKDTKVVHFLGPVKPWHHVYNRVTGGVQQIAGPMHTGTQHLPQYLSEWWAIYNDSVQKYFSREQEMYTDHLGNTEIRPNLATVNQESKTPMAEDKSFEDIVLIPAAILQSDKEQEGAASASRSPDERQREMLAHMRQWESGNIDYLGRDSFENIQARLESFMHQKPV